MSRSRSCSSTQPELGSEYMHIPEDADPDFLIPRATAAGYDPIQTQVLSQAAFESLAEIKKKGMDTPITKVQLAQAMKEQLAVMAKREARTQRQLDIFGVTPNRLMEGAEGYDYEGSETYYESSSDEFDEEAGSDEDEEDDEDDDMADWGGSRKRLKPWDGLTRKIVNGKEVYMKKDFNDDMAQLSLKHTSNDILTALSQSMEIAVELGKHLEPADVINVFIVCPTFRRNISSHYQSSIMAWVKYKAPEARKIFTWKIYRKSLTVDPAGRTWDEKQAMMNVKAAPRCGDSADQVRLVPGLRYLQLVVGRSRCCREIIAILARSGHRVPPGMYSTLLRLWVLMELATTRNRRAVLANKEYWTDEHLYNAQFFFIKLTMAFNHPYFGPHTNSMVHLIMGQKGLYPLWQCLTRRRFQTISEVLGLSASYSMELSWDHWSRNYEDGSVFGIPFSRVGAGHCEGWGMGVEHLARPDELIPYEAVNRGLRLDDHVRHMIVWGYIDWDTGENLIPTAEEMYISDEEEVLKYVDTAGLWNLEHVRKKNWKSLTAEEQQEIKDEEEDHRLRCMAWSGLPNDDLNDDGIFANEPYDGDAILLRGVILPDPKEMEKQTLKIPGLDDGPEAWTKILKETLSSDIPKVKVTKAEIERARLFQSFRNHEYSSMGRSAREFLGRATEALERVEAEEEYSEGEEADNEDDEDDEDDEMKSGDEEYEDE